ncbi:MAG: cyclase family protein [Nitrososphaeraceae archaeon]|jgi:arylformamidase
MEIVPSMRVFPGSPQPSFIEWSKFEIHGYSSEVMFLSTHTGTHIDAPSHFIPDSRTIDKIKVSRFVSRSILIKIPKKADQQITLNDIINCKIHANDTVVFATGWEKRFKNDNYMINNPGLSLDAAEYLVSNRVNAVAIDGPSIDRGVDNNFNIHSALLSNDIPIIENLCNLEELSSVKSFTLIVNPLKLVGASGSPVRAIALV